MSNESMIANAKAEVLNDGYKTVRGLYGIRDEAIQGFKFFHDGLSDGDAIRVFKDQLKNPKTVFFNHPEDYSLWRVGDIGMEDGVLVPLTPIKLLHRGEAQQTAALRDSLPPQPQV